MKTNNKVNVWGALVVASFVTSLVVAQTNMAENNITDDELLTLLETVDAAPEISEELSAVPTAEASPAPMVEELSAASEEEASENDLLSEVLTSSTTEEGQTNETDVVVEEVALAEVEAEPVLENEMIDDLRRLNESGSMACPPEVLESVWSENMIWYGPAGVGATYTIPRYQEQHQLPFRNNLDDKKYIGHVCRFAEGNFACFFGWPNLSNTPLGGWLGLPGVCQLLTFPEKLTRNGRWLRYLLWFRYP